MKIDHRVQEIWSGHGHESVTDRLTDEEHTYNPRSACFPASLMTWFSLFECYHRLHEKCSSWPTGFIRSHLIWIYSVLEKDRFYSAGRGLTLLASDDFYRLLITFANSLELDQEQQYDTLIVFLKELFEKS